jgi:hypothetical protein
MQKSPQNRAKHICKAKTTIFFGFAKDIRIFWKLPMEFIASLLCINIFFVKALRQRRRIREVIKQWNVNFSKKLKQWSDETFNAGKEIEAMKRLTLHRIASSLHHFMASVAQLWSRVQSGAVLSCLKVLFSGCVLLRWLYIFSSRSSILNLKTRHSQSA